MQLVIRTGDTLWYYSQLFSIPLVLIMDSNRGINPDDLQPGQKIVLPGFIRISYKIKQGDTLWKLAQRRNISLDSILLMNQQLNPQRLRVGEVIQLPQRIISPLLKRGVPYNYARLTEDLQKMKEIYPFIKLNTIGYSVMGKPIQELTIGRGQKRIHFDASFHANEWITSAVLMEVVDSFLLSLINGQTIRGLHTMPYYDTVQLSIVPMVDPDGVNLVIDGPPPELKESVITINKGSTNFNGWKANIRGVDLNNQFPANWQIEKERKEEKAPAPRDYPGDAPLTEPEAIAMAELARKRLFHMLIALHTQGEEFYWGYEGLEPSNSKRIATEFERVSGYKAVRSIDSHAGYKDWFIQEFRKPGFTIELGLGTNPLPLSQFDEMVEEFLGIFLAAMYME